MQSHTSRPCLFTRTLSLHLFTTLVSILEYEKGFTKRVDKSMMFLPLVKLDRATFIIFVQ